MRARPFVRSEVAAVFLVWAGSIFENAGGVTDVVKVNDCSNLGNADSRTGVVGVIGGVGTIIVDEVDALHCLSERDGGDSKFFVETENSVDTEPRLSNPPVWSLSTSDTGFMCVAWKRACGGSEPKTCTRDKSVRLSSPR